MYSGSTLTNRSGNLAGAHQKLDRIARKSLADLLKQNTNFPATKLILHFEGKNGPDSAKIKLDGEHAPWHFFDPFDTDDSALVKLIIGHKKNLVKSLKANNLERAAFEASWMAHAIVDGLTPAHHYPFEEELEKLIPVLFKQLILQLIRLTVDAADPDTVSAYEELVCNSIPLIETVPAPVNVQVPLMITLGS